ncbi:MAG: FAD:protein FMN transferase [Planctomycetaceae bacterium]|nr:FAD:protein FMN transferase [Planctomycetaceae bacterium]
MNRYRPLAALLLLTTFASDFARAEPRALGRYRFSEPHLGTLVQITVYAPDETVAKGIVGKAFRRISDLNKVLSDYDRDSELSRLVATIQPGQPAAVSDDFFRVLDASLKLAQRTNGAFDPTLGPVIRLWRQARRTGKLPDPDRLHDARERVGFRQITLDTEHKSVTLSRTGISIDFGGIAKGDIAQEALNVLKSNGLKHALVAIAGDIAAGDPPPDAPGWRVGVAAIAPSSEEPAYWLRLENMAVSTSGDAFQYVEIDGVRYSHIVDPATGLGLTERSSVTVIAPTGIQADGLATAATVLGREAGLKLIEESDGCAAVYIVADDNGVTSRVSSRFSSFEWSDQ